MSKTFRFDPNEQKQYRDGKQSQTKSHYSKEGKEQRREWSRLNRHKAKEALYNGEDPFDSKKTSGWNTH